MQDLTLAYVGGDTKILAVDRSIRFSGIISKLSNLCDADVYFKYQLPGDDVDALISVTNAEDLEHMMIEYDRLNRASAKPARLRLFLFPINPAPPAEPKSDWFVDALNSLPIQSLDASSPPAAAAKQTNPDFLFGLDKGSAPPAPASANLQESVPETAVSGVPPSDISVLSDSSREDRHMGGGGGGEQILSPSEIQRQIQELQRLHLASQEQQPVMFQRKSDENLSRAYAGEYYVQSVPEKTVPVPAPVPATMSIPPAYWQERHMTTGGYAPPPPPVAATGAEQPVYLMHAPAGMYQAQPPPPTTMRPVTNQLGQGYYAMQRMVPDVYRDSAMYGMGPPPPQPQPPPTSQPGKVGMGAYTEGGGVGLVRQQPQPQAAGGVPVQMTAETGYTQVGYDSAGRQVYYTTPGGMVPQYQTVSAAGVDVRQGGGGGGGLNPDGKLAKVSQTSV